MEVASHYLRQGSPVIATLLDCSKAFDKCLFDKLFGKLIAKGLLAVVICVLVFMYEEQQGWVKLGGKRSSSFQLTNGTRQGVGEELAAFLELHVMTVWLMLSTDCMAEMIFSAPYVKRLDLMKIWLLIHFLDFIRFSIWFFDKFQAHNFMPGVVRFLARNWTVQGKFTSSTSIQAFSFFHQVFWLNFTEKAARISFHSSRHCCFDLGNHWIWSSQF